MRVNGTRVGLKDHLFAGMAEALRGLAQTDPDQVVIVFGQLRADPHESAWFLLARGYAANPDRFADDAAAWLTDTPGALHLGYQDAPHWVSRELIAGFVPLKLSPDAPMTDSVGVVVRS